MTSPNLAYWCDKKNKWQPYWCIKPILVHIGITKPILNYFWMQSISFVQGGKTRLSCCPITFDSRLSPVSLRKQPFPPAPHRWGRFARRNVCDSRTEIPYWWRKICPSKVLIGRRSSYIVLAIVYEWQKATKGKCKRDESLTKQSIFVEYILLWKKHLSFAGARSQMNTKLYQIRPGKT